MPFYRLTMGPGVSAAHCGHRDRAARDVELVVQTGVVCGLRARQDEGVQVQSDNRGGLAWIIILNITLSL